MTELLQAVAALLAISNPIGAAPIFLSIVGEAPSGTRHRAARSASVAVFLILALSALLGRVVLRLFGVSIPAFQAAGGLVIILMGLEMLRGEPTRVQHDRSGEDDPEEKILVPFAMPMVAGPGAITTIITLSVAHTRGFVPVVALGAAAITALTLWLVLTIIASEERLISPRGRRIMTRFMGLLLVAIGFQIGLEGLSHFSASAATLIP